MILHSQFNLAFQFRRPDRAILLFTIKIMEMFELHRSIPPMRSTEHQATIPLKFLITIHNYANVLTIKVTTRFLGSDVTGGHYWPVDSDVAERRKRLEAIV